MRLSRMGCSHEDSARPPARGHRRAMRGPWERNGLGRPKVALEGDRDHGETTSLSPRRPTAQRSRLYRRPGVLIVDRLRGDMTRRLHPCPGRRSRASFWWHCRGIAQGSLGLFRRRRKFPCQGQIMASRSVAEQTNTGFGATGARQHPDQCAPVVDPSVGGACAFLQPRWGRGGASRSRRTDRGGRGISADARVPIRARTDAHRYRPQP
jgi:hypothetical protein